MKSERETQGSPAETDINIKEKGKGGIRDFLKFLARLEEKYPDKKWISEKTKEDWKTSKRPILVLFAEEKGETIATLIGEIDQNQKTSIYAAFMAVDPEYQKRGVGTKLLNHLKTHYLSIDLYAISLGIGLNQENLYKFYIKNGFRRVDEDSHRMAWGKQNL